MTKHTVKTEEDVLKAFESESRAKWTYRAFADKAEQQGDVNIAKLFRAVAEAEQIHAESLKNALHETSRATNELWAAGLYDPKIVKDSIKENLQEAVAESSALSQMYKQMITDAEQDGWSFAKQCFTYASTVDEAHAQLFKKFLDNPDVKASAAYYICNGCGNTRDAEPTGSCNVCGSSESAFKVFR